MGHNEDLTSIIINTHTQIEQSTLYEEMCILEKSSFYNAQWLARLKLIAETNQQKKIFTPLLLFLTIVHWTRLENVLFHFTLLNTTF